MLQLKGQMTGQSAQESSHQARPEPREEVLSPMLSRARCATRIDPQRTASRCRAAVAFSARHAQRKLCALNLRR